MKTILVCGGRNYGDIKQGDVERLNEYQRIVSYLDDAATMWPRSPNGLLDVRIVTGAAPGVDTVAIDWARVNMCTYKEYPADWHVHGKAAGPIRNAHMLEDAAPDLVIAFPGGRGTADMVRRARAAGVEVIEPRNLSGL